MTKTSSSLSSSFLGGSLSFKGDKKKKDKKAKKKHKKSKQTLLLRQDDDGGAVAGIAKDQKTKENGSDKHDDDNDDNDDNDDDNDDDDDDELTEAERNALRLKRQRQRETNIQIASKSHRDRVEELNEKLGSLTEHNDIPRVSAAGNG